MNEQHGIEAIKAASEATANLILETTDALEDGDIGFSEGVRLAKRSLKFAKAVSKGRELQQEFADLSPAESVELSTFLAGTLNGKSHQQAQEAAHHVMEALAHLNKAREALTK